tara:strand:- start:5126 stop:6001 length:876 start_codon:yes stop_codon:yes gene_type:complete
MSHISFFNGKFIPTNEVSLNLIDNFLTVVRGYQVFTFLKTTNQGQPIFLDHHINRVFNNVDKMKMEIEESKEDVKSLVLETLKKNDCSKQECNIMITFLGGKTGDSSGLIAAHPSRLLIFITPSRKHPEEFYINGISVGLIEHARSNADIKSPMTYGPALLAQNTLAKDGAYNEILYTDKGRVLEGTTFSFFIIKDDESVVTSKADGSILSSITRLVLIDILKNNQINVEERDLTLDEVYQSKEAFIASSTRDVIPVVSIENNAIGDGKIGNTTKKIMDLYQLELSTIKSD